MNQIANMQSAVNLSRLARDLAMDIYEVDQIRQTYALSTEQFSRIVEEPQFAKMLRDMIVDWQSASGTAERVKVKSAVGVEIALDIIMADVVDRTVPLTQRIDALKLLARLGELGEKEAALGGGGGSGVQININLGVPGQGQPPKTIHIDAEPIPEESPVLPG